MKIWRPSYNPFGFGSCHKPICTEISDNTPKIDVGLGFKVVVITYGTKTYVFEVESGGLVGASLEEVKEDVAYSGNAELMRQQIEKAKEKGNTAQKVSFEQFFKD